MWGGGPVWWRIDSFQGHPRIGRFIQMIPELTSAAKGQNLLPLLSTLELLLHSNSPFCSCLLRWRCWRLAFSSFRLAKGSAGQAQQRVRSTSRRALVAQRRLEGHASPCGHRV